MRQTEQELRSDSRVTLGCIVAAVCWLVGFPLMFVRSVGSKMIGLEPDVEQTIGSVLVFLGLLALLWANKRKRR